MARPEAQTGIKPEGDFGKYLDTRFKTGTSQKLERLLKKEIASLTDAKPDNIRNPDLHLALRLSEHTIIFRAVGVSDYSRQKALAATKKEVGNIFERGYEQYFPTTWAAAHLVLGGEKFWSATDHERMKKDLGEKINNLLKEDPGNGNSSSADKRSAEAAEGAATYKLLFKEKVWSLEQEKQMIEATEKEFDRFNSEGFPDNNTIPLSRRAATLSVLSDSS